ncbi:MAG: pseudouridine-5'-phosphate glycosidase [Phycisphaerales bacterium]
MHPHDWLIIRASRPAAALESTILAHGLPRSEARAFADELFLAASDAGVTAAFVGVLDGRGIVGMTRDELHRLLDASGAVKTNASNLGLVIHARRHGATTVSTTLELAAAAGLRVFATGGIGGVHRGYASRLDISADLGAMARHPVAVVSSGCKNILDLTATRELLETLGIPVVGFRCDRFPAFYQRETDLPVDGRFDDADELADFLRFELSRTGRGVLVANPVPEADEIPAAEWDTWFRQAEQEMAAEQGRDATPALLARVHALSQGRTVRSNISLARSNARLGFGLAAAIGQR